MTHPNAYTQTLTQAHTNIYIDKHKLINKLTYKQTSIYVDQVQQTSTSYIVQKETIWHTS